MMAGALRFILGILMLPACWAAARALADALVFSANASDGFSAESLSLLGGMLAFALCWVAAPRPVKAYVFAHELTHAFWGVLFGAVPSQLKVTAKGGSVRLTKTNILITLAPYFFPFYTFLVIVAALVTYIFARPLPLLPMWLFLVGFTWAFHVLFTFQTLTVRQPDITTFGRLFSWTFIFIANALVVMVWLAAATPLGFPRMGSILADRARGAYTGVADAARTLYDNLIQWRTQ